jgi:hypothetical protein
MKRQKVAKPAKKKPDKRMRKKASPTESVRGVSSAKKESSVEPLATRHLLPFTAAEQLSAQVAALQSQIAALCATVEQQKGQERQESSVETPLASPSRGPDFQSQVSVSSPATSDSLPVTDAQQPDLSAQVSELQAQIAALRKSIEHSQASPSPVSAFQSQVSAVPSPFPVSGLKSQASSSIPIYELKETRPVGYQNAVKFETTLEESSGSLFGGLFDRARIHWITGDWKSLGQMDIKDLEHHPARAKLALLFAVGRLQTDHREEAKKLFYQATQWGADRKLTLQVLFAGAHHNLAYAAALAEQHPRMLRHRDAAKQLGLAPSAAAGPLSLLAAPTPKDYCIKKGYSSRNRYVHFDDMLLHDEWQLEVYTHAAAIMERQHFSTVADIGCGSGFKFVKYLGHYRTLGYELPQNVRELKTLYPDRRWETLSFDDRFAIHADLVICSDVIEHLVDPDELMVFLQKQDFQILVLSTPERDIVRGVADFGPPANPAHQREWNFNEFRQYTEKFFDIIEHKITNHQQATQMVVCSKNIKC